MGISATPEQVGALAAINSFLLDETLDAFIPPGSAGTDKKTLIVALVDQLEGMNLSSALLAPTAVRPASSATQSAGLPVKVIAARRGFTRRSTQRTGSTSTWMPNR